MANGTINLSESATSGTRVAGKIVWESTPDAASNTSKNVTAKIYIRKYNPDMTLTIPTSGTWSYELTVNGAKVSGSISKGVLLDWVLIATNKVSSISHNSDGKKSITISGSVTAPSGTSLAGHVTKGSGTAVLDELSVSSEINFASETILGNQCHIRWNPLTNTSRYRVNLSIGTWSKWSDIIYQGNATSYSYREIIPLEVANQITDSAKGTMTATLYTYSDADATVQVGTPKSKTFGVIVPENEDTKPYVEARLAPSNNLPSALSGLYIQGITKVSAYFQGYGQYGATIDSYTMYVDGKTYNGYESDFLTTPKTQQVTITAIDSRGFHGTATYEIDVVAYTKPKIKNVIAERCDANGNLGEDGTSLRITATREYNPIVVSGEQKNFCSIQYRALDENGSVIQQQSTILSRDSATDTVTTGALAVGKLSVSKSYTVEVQAVDDISPPTVATIVVAPESVYMHRDGRLNSMGLGKYVEDENLLDVAWDAHFRGEVRIGENGMTLREYILTVVNGGG
jgi:hypothetical protein